MIINLPDNVGLIIQRLNDYGFEAYVVGGCVRDSILHKEPKDWDITTNAMPYQIKQIFKRTIDTGIKHGTVTVMIGKDSYEITTYRIDGNYEDGRHPVSVEFTLSLEEDLKRRDFTINAMAYNPERGLVDMFSGISDMERHIIRCVGEPGERFSEDALRMLRAVRFSAQLGYGIEVQTAQAIRRLAPAISRISRERIHSEINKILLSSNPGYIMQIVELDLSQYIFPVIEEIKDVNRTIKLMEALPDELCYRYAALMYMITAERARKILKDLKLDNNTVDTTSRIIGYHGSEYGSDAVSVRQKVSSMGIDIFKKVLLFDREYYRIWDDEERLGNCNNASALLRDILERKECLSLKELAVTGRDLIEAGIPPGVEMGRILDRMLKEVLVNPQNNTKEYLFNNHLHI